MLCLIVSVADVISWQMLYALLKLWQMLLPRGRCYPLSLCVADVIANFAVVDVIPLTVYCNTLCWLVLLPCGRWNSHTFLLCVVVADVIAQWQMEWPLQGVSVFLLVDVIPRGRGMFMGRITLVSVLRCYAEPHPIHEADGTCLCFCLGKDYLPL